MKDNRPPLALSTAVIFLLAAVWGYVRMVLFRDVTIPLSFVLPMLVCLWTQRRWHLWFLTAVFIAMSIIKNMWLLSPSSSQRGDMQYLAGTIANLVVTAIVIQVIIGLRERLERRNARIAAQNEELKDQAEELAEQNEEIESQSEEAARRNEELVESYQRLTSRENILQNLLESSRSPGSGAQAIRDLCGRALAILGEPARHVAVLESRDAGFAILTYAGPDALPDHWPAENSLAGLVVREGRTAYVSDFAARADLAAPFGANGPVRSMLATPIRFANGEAGVLAACGTSAAHWTDEQFRLIEWVAAQFGLLVESLRWHRAVEDRAVELEAANNAKDRFLAMLSHELRTPLTPVLAAAGSLENDPRLPEPIRDDLRMMRRNVAIQSRLIDDLLDLTRIGKGKVDLNEQSHALSALLRDSAAIVAADLDAKEQTLELHLEPLDRHTVRGDGPRLQQVFWNLLKNAIKFSPAGAVIQLRAEIPPGRDVVRIEVRDQGVGIDAHDAERIFQPFEQVIDGPHRKNDAGLGLGLAIAKAVVEMHGGTISVNSPGRSRGASFVVELPLAGAAAADPQTTGSAAGELPAGNGKLRILLVEDHVDTGLILSRLLKASGYSVRHALTASHAIELFSANEFDLVISDLGLPDESGLQLMRRLRGLRPGITGICLSGYGTQDDRAACEAAGFGEHITKPIEMPQLESAISRAISGRRPA